MFDNNISWFTISDQYNMKKTSKQKVYTKYVNFLTPIHILVNRISCQVIVKFSALSNCYESR